MSVPTSYTDTEFKDYLHNNLGALAVNIGWTVVGGQYDETLISTLIAMGLTDTSQVTASAIEKFRDLGRLQVWSDISGEIATKYDHVADGLEIDQSAVMEYQKSQVARYKSEAAKWLDSGTVIIKDLSFATEDPYAVDREALI